MVKRLYLLMLKHLTILCLFIALATQSNAQVNLVPNGSFEDTLQCPIGYSCLRGYTANWFNPLDTTIFTPDLFNVCASAFYNGVPDNSLGHLEPQNGNSYIGMYVYYSEQFIGFQVREPLAVKLIEPLKHDTTYKLTMYVSLGGGFVEAAISNMGFAVSADSLYQTGNNCFLNFTPQDIKRANDTANIIYNVGLWEKLEFTFDAKGGEEFLYIGNLDPDSLTHTYFFGDNPDMALGYYLVDNVSITREKKTDVSESVVGKIKLYPNPATENITITLPPNTNKAELLVYTVQGQLLSQTQLSGTQTINTNNLSNGLYLFVIQLNGHIIGREKVIIAH